MAKYKVLETCFIDNHLCQPGDVIDFEGETGPHLEKVKPGKKVEVEPAEVEDTAS